jgi:hypothetical protein
MSTIISAFFALLKKQTRPTHWEISVSDSESRMGGLKLVAGQGFEPAAFRTDHF